MARCGPGRWPTPNAPRRRWWPALCWFWRRCRRCCCRPCPPLPCWRFCLCCTGWPSTPGYAIPSRAGTRDCAPPPAPPWWPCWCWRLFWRSGAERARAPFCCRLEVVVKNDVFIGAAHDADLVGGNVLLLRRGLRLADIEPLLHELERICRGQLVLFAGQAQRAVDIARAVERPCRQPLGVHANQLAAFGKQVLNPFQLAVDDPVRDKPRRSGRGRIARTAQPSLSLGFSVEFAAARCTGARWKSARRRSLKRNRTATTARLSSSASGCRAVPCAAGDWRRL